MIYATPVHILQQQISMEHFHELQVYDDVWGLQRHADLTPQKEQPRDPEAEIRMVLNKDEPKRPTGLIQRLPPSKHGKKSR